MDEIAGGRALTRDVRLEVSVDVVLQLAVERPGQQSLEVLQTMRVVGQTEFTGKNKQMIIVSNSCERVTVREFSNHKTTSL